MVGTRVKQDRISNLPQELIELILFALPVQDAAKTSILSKSWRLRWALLCNQISRRRFVTCSEDDRISNSLPDKLIDYILDKLPVEDAARTSILSKTWRYRWTSMNALVFSKHFSNFKMLQTQAAGFAHDVDNACSFLTFFMAETLSKLPPHMFARLKRLDLLDINFSDLDQLHGVSYMLRNTPNLERLCVRNEHMMEDWQHLNVKRAISCLEGMEGNFLDFTLTRLHTVTFIHLDVTQPERLFISLLQKRSPTLRNLIVHPRPTHDNEKHLSVCKGLIFSRASYISQVFYMLPDTDEDGGEYDYNYYDYVKERVDNFVDRRQAIGLRLRFSLRNLVNNNGNGYIRL